MVRAGLELWLCLGLRLRLGLVKCYGQGNVMIWVLGLGYVHGCVYGCSLG